MAGLSTTLRVVLAAGGSNGVPPGTVVEPGPDGAAVVDGVEERAILALSDTGRGRLFVRDQSGETSHDVLVLQLPEARRAAAGVQRVEVVIEGWRFEVDVEPEARARLRDRATRAAADRGRAGPVELRAIIPGRVVSVDVADGDEVAAGSRVMVVEAMKMQNELRAPRAGTIRRLAVGAGQTVELGDVLLVIE